MALKRRLGRGLDSLIPSVADSTEETALQAEAAQALSLDLIDPNPQQPRKEFPQEELDALAESIRKHGVLQPVLVRPRGSRYELVVGERRLRASRLAGVSTIPAVVRDISDEQMLVLALIENLQRQDLDPIEKAQAYARLVRELRVSHEEVAERLNISRSLVTNTMRLLELEPEIQRMVSGGLVSAGHARALLGVADAGARLSLAKRVAAEGLSVRQVEDAVAARTAPPKQAGPKGEPSAHILDLENQLQEALGTKVRIVQRRRGGQIVIRFGGNDDFERIFSVLVSRTML